MLEMKGTAEKNQSRSGKGTKFDKRKKSSGIRVKETGDLEGSDAM